MVLGSSARGPPHAQRTVFRVRKANQSIKEAAGKHPGAEINNLLQEDDMVFNDTALRFPNRGPLSEAGWKNRKNGGMAQNTGYRGLADTRKPAEHKVQGTMSHTKAGYVRKSGPVVTQKYRIVRDNRSYQNSDTSLKKDPAQNSDNSSKQVDGDVADSRNIVELLISPISEGQFDSHQDHASLELSMVDGEIIPELKMSALSLSRTYEGCIKNEKELHSSMVASATMTIGMYSCATDPVHVPSADTRSAGAIGAARRHVGVVGSQRQNSIHPSTQSSVADCTFSIQLPRKGHSPTSESSGHKLNTPRSSILYRVSASEPIMSSTSIIREFPVNRFSNRPNQQVVVHQKATLSNMEWRPKSSQKSRISSPSSQVEADDLSGRVTQANIPDGGHVIIPKHLKVPEAEQTHLTFGSFGDQFNLNKSVTFLTCENQDQSSDNPHMRQSVAVPVGSPKNISAVCKADVVSSNIASPQSDSSLSAAGTEQVLPAHSESSSPKDIHAYSEINMVLSHNPPFSPFKPQQSENSPTIQCFLGYGQQAARDSASFPTAAIDENAQPSLSSTSETLALNATCSIRQSSVTMVQQQQQQLPPVSQLYSQVHIPQFTNFVPYQHMMTPMYVPPISIPNYSGNPAYIPSPYGSNCLFMQGGNANVAVGGFKHAAQQYKPVHAGSPVGYASYTCPAGYTVGAPGTVVSAASTGDMAGFKYMDCDSYAPNLQQVEASDIWPQVPQELAGVHPPPYELLGQGTMTSAPYAQTHTGRAFHGGAHSSCLQYPSGLYHPSPPGFVAGHPHHLTRQQVPLPGAAGPVIAAHIDPAGTYQQTQLGQAEMWPSM